MLALGKIKELSRAELDAGAEAIRVLTGAGQRPFVSKTQRIAGGKVRTAGLIFVEFCLEPDPMIETEGGWQTFDQLEKGKAQHLRCQAPIRPDSTSWAAFFGRHADGGGFIFDEGTRTKYCLSRARAKPSWEDLDHVLEDLGPTERDWRDRVKSSVRGRWIAKKEVRRDPVVLELLERASDAPVLKSGMVDRSRLPQRFTAYLPFAWSRLLSMLPEHGRIDAALARLLGTMVGGDFAGGHDSCSLGHWAWRCARVTRASGAGLHLRDLGPPDRRRTRSRSRCGRRSSTRSSTAARAGSPR